MARGAAKDVQQRRPRRRAFVGVHEPRLLEAKLRIAEARLCYRESVGLKAAPKPRGCRPRAARSRAARRALVLVEVAVLVLRVSPWQGLWSTEYTLLYSGVQEYGVRSTGLPGAWSTEYGVRSRSTEYGVRSTGVQEYRVLKLEYGVQQKILKRSAHGVKIEPWSMEYGVWSMEYGVWSAWIGVLSVEYGVHEYGVRRTGVWSTEYST